RRPGRGGAGGRGRRPGGEQRRRPPVQVRIDSIAAGGEGVGRLADGRVVFVHRTAPGDLAEVELTERRDRWARGRLLRVLEPSPERREAPCPFYGECGGCTLEHLTYPAQLRAKARIVSDALTRIGGVPTEPPEVVPSPSEHRYRNRVSFALRRTGRGGVAAGVHALGDPDRIVDLDGRCLLPEEPIARAWDAIRAAWGRDAFRLPSGDQLRLTLRASATGEVSLLVEGGYSPGRPQELLDAVPGLAAVWHRPGEAPPSLVAGAPGLPETWGDETVELSGAAFLQVNRGAAALLEAHVVERIGDPAGLRVVDAYCGVGLHARRLARAGASVVGIELDPEAVAEARRGAPEGAAFDEGPVETLLPGRLPADLVILNPPRAGIAAEVAEALSASPPERIVYVSCNPATLARDLKRLGPRFAMRSLRSFDLFPQTAHVETVVVLSTQTP
ncbi:MAG TPA: class I SAM-dependent RNA methyltransferase, partial [Longimicrobiaceae bacterium]|nr:class I SAM-dependent RNA methyltransferase [Longimicrobiaceae bacterium]